MMCQAVEFNHLPNAGGMLDQHPDLMDRFVYIWGEQAAHRKKEEAQQKKNKMGQGKRSSRPS